MKYEECVIEGCGGAHRAKGFCRKHYQRWTRGNLLVGRKAVLAFLAQRDGTTKCFYCGEREGTDVEHRIPWSLAKGKPWCSSSWNLRRACRPCNSSKGDSLDFPGSEVEPEGPHVLCHFGNRLKTEQRKQERIDSGLCVDCGEERGEEGAGYHCGACWDKVLAAQRRKNKRFHASGICETCGKPRGPRGTKRKCRACADEYNESLRAARATKYGLKVSPQYWDVRRYEGASWELELRMTQALGMVDNEESKPAPRLCGNDEKTMLIRKARVSS